MMIPSITVKTVSLYYFLNSITFDLNAFTQLDIVDLADPGSLLDMKRS